MTSSPMDVNLFFLSLLLLWPVPTPLSLSLSLIRCVSALSGTSGGEEIGCLVSLELMELA